MLDRNLKKLKKLNDILIDEGDHPVSNLVNLILQCPYHTVENYEYRSSKIEIFAYHYLFYDIKLSISVDVKLLHQTSKFTENKKIQSGRNIVNFKFSHVLPGRTTREFELNEVGYKSTYIHTSELETLINFIKDFLEEYKEEKLLISLIKD